MSELRLPELGENIETAEVARVLVAAGDRVTKDQPVIEVETDKASLDVPATAAGVVTEVPVAAGDTIRVGDVIAVLRDDEAADEAPATGNGSGRESTATSPPAGSGHTAAPAAGAGEGSEEYPGATAPGPAGASEPRPAESESPAVADDHDVAGPAPSPGPPAIGATVPAAPSVRRLARELGLDIGRVTGSGPGGRIGRDDVKAHAKRLLQTSRAPAETAPPPELPDFGRWGEVVREPLSKVRRVTAANMARAWSTVPHVTQHDQADITQIEAMRRRINERAGPGQAKLTVTAIVVKMAAAALRRFPQFNASLDLAGDEVVYKQYVHIGVAVDTDRGLLVPVIRDADRRGLVDVAAALTDLAARARERRIAPDEMAGACFTVSNLGGLGTTTFSPIVNWPEVAILGIGRAQVQAVYESGTFQPRQMLPLSLSYDHRLIDGAEAARFLRWLAEALEQPLLYLLDTGG